ncbi:unnamed protein product [Closterium sp. Yama58-4]|nr:unnamed protein product [Closterium sp. Yama58-4]
MPASWNASGASWARWRTPSARIRASSVRIRAKSRYEERVSQAANDDGGRSLTILRTALVAFTSHRYWHNKTTTRNFRFYEMHEEDLKSLNKTHQRLLDSRPHPSFRRISLHRNQHRILHPPRAIHRDSAEAGARTRKQANGGDVELAGAAGAAAAPRRRAAERVARLVATRVASRRRLARWSVAAGCRHTPPSTVGRHPPDTLLALIVTSAVLFVGVVILVIVFCRTRRRTPQVAPLDGKATGIVDSDSDKVNGEGREEEEEGEEGESGYRPVEQWSWEEVEAATDGFSEERTIEDAGHSAVFRAVGRGGEELAVKRAKRVSVEGQHLFRNQVEFLEGVRHPNIVSLLAFSDDRNEQILVFEFVPNGSLTDWLRPLDVSKPALTFGQRLAIGAEVARAIKYLHSKAPPVLHRDIKSETILLDNDFKVKLGGLGVLKHLPGEAMRLRMQRKRGYLDPEYFQSFRITSKCDVYSFGVVLLELITAKLPIVDEKDVVMGSRTSKRFVTLVQWALPKIKEGKYNDMVDPRLGAYPGDLMEIFCGIAAECVTPQRKNRPDIDVVSAWMDELIQKDAASREPLSRFMRAVPEEEEVEEDGYAVEVGEVVKGGEGGKEVVVVMTEEAGDGEEGGEWSNERPKGGAAPGGGTEIAASSADSVGAKTYDIGASAGVAAVRPAAAVSAEVCIGVDGNVAPAQKEDDRAGAELQADVAS